MQNRRKFIKKTLSLGAALLPPFDHACESASPLSYLPIVDTHFHMWDLEHLDYDWLENNSSELSRDFSLADYEKETASFHVKKMVFVESGCASEQYLDEVKWVMAQSKIDFRIQGIVAFFPIEKGKQATGLLEEMARQPLVKGIRRMAAPAMMAESGDFLQGLQLLSRHSLSFDLHVAAKDFKELLPVLDRCPNTTFILNHMALPDIKAGEWEIWKKGIAQLSKRPHVFCKLSGILTRAASPWTADDLKPYVLHVLEHFGIERVMYGSDWPVLRRASNFQGWTGTLEHIFTALSKEEMKKIFYSNAVSVYRL